ncbi:alpha/beta hydrolase [Sphingomonas sp. Root710]|uniref:alpha/beta hydrolase n=1 Tax=Sphingomonas sp. Root710 TaxID=1736594 RepID=UPI001F322B1B|nr:alpha/beta fold hydrolase [Sphingomonas sp. Root710]
MTMRRAAVLLGVLILLGLGASWVVGAALTRPHPGPATPPSPHDLTIASADGVSLAATYLPGPGDRTAAILLLHPKGGSRHGFDALAAWLNRRGYATLAIDFRGHGQSTPARYSFGWDESRDAAAAFHWLKRQQHGAPVAVVGLSLGGAASLLGDGPLPADALILQGVYGDLRQAIRNRIATVTGAGPAWLLEPLLSFQTKPRIGMWPGDLSPRSRIAAYRGPLLVIGGGADRYTPPSETRALYAAAPGPKRLWFAPGASHEAVTALDTPAYRKTLLAFVQERLPTAPPAR